jgi:sec-independent protein translocase protein TatA
MFDIGLQEMLVIGVIALLVFGPSKLPELGRMFGRALREFRRASDEFRSTVETNLHINDPDPVMMPGPTAEPVPVMPAARGEPAEVESTPRATPAEPAPALEGSSPYCAQGGARLFHRRQCTWAARIPDAERVDLKRAVDARDQGFVACPVCEPTEDPDR